MKIILTFVTYLVFIVSAIAQRPAADFNAFNPSFEVFHFPDELGVNSVNSMVQDSLGFIWFGSQSGLHRFDGQKFVTYYHEPDNPNSLGSNFIVSIFLDSRGVLWITHEKGLTAFDPALEKFTRYQDLSGTVVSEDRNGYIWCGGLNGLNRLDRKTGEVKLFRYDPNNPRSLSCDNVLVLYIDKTGTLWVGTGYRWKNIPEDKKPGGVNRYDPETESFTRYMSDPQKPQTLANNYVISIFEDSRGNLMVGTDDGLQLLNRAKGTFTRPTYSLENQGQASIKAKLSRIILNNDPISAIAEDGERRIWIAVTGRGLYVYDPRTDKIQHFETAPGKGNLSTNNLSGIFESADGVIWIISAFASTIFKVNKQTGRFPFYMPAGWAPDDMVSDAVKDRDGNIWLSYFNKPNSPLVRYERKTGKTFSIARSRSGLNASNINTLETDPRGFLWLGTENGLFQYNLQTGKFRHFINPQALAAYIGWMTRDSKGYLWIYGESGLNRLDPNTGEFMAYRHDPSDTSSISGNFSAGLFEDSKGNFWTGSDDSKPFFFDRFNPMVKGENGKTTFTHFGKGINTHSTESICEDSQGNIWFFDHTDGIFKFNPDDKALHKLDLGGINLSPRTLIDMARIKNGRIWINTSGGFIYELDVEKGRLTAFGKDQGIPGSGLSERSEMYVADDGEVIIGRSGGFIAFYPDSLFQERNKRPPLLHITDFRLLDERVLPTREGILKKNIWLTDFLSLRHDQNIFSFSVSCFDFNEPSSCQIQFMLEGFDQDWRTDLLDGETPPYMYVTPGSYTFRVRGSSNIGAWNLKETSLRISVLPPWWRSWWAYIAYTITLIALLLFIRKYELNRISVREEARHIKELDNFKTKLYTNVTHEFRTPLTLILGPVDQMLRSKDLRWEFKQALAVIQRNARSLLQLVEELLDLSSLDAGTLKLQEKQVLFKPLIQRIAASFESQAAIKQIGFTIRFDADPDLSLLLDSLKFERIVINILSNAFRHTPSGGRIEIQVRTLAPEKSHAAKRLEIQVSDTGKGIHPDDLPHIFERFFQTKQASQPIEGGAGIGLALCREYAYLLEGNLSATSTLGQGSTFTFTFPMKQIVSGLVPEAAEAVQTPALKFSTARQGSASPGGQDFTILLVEDNQDMQAFVKANLQPFGNVITANNGKEALEKLHAIRAPAQLPHLIVSDVMMPEMDGFMFLETLRSDADRRHIPVIMLTARAGKEDRLQALRFGVDDYMTKPFDTDELQARVNNLLQRVQHLKNPETGFPFAPVTSADDLWLKDLEKKSLAGLDRQLLTVTYLADEMALSERQLRRKIQQLTGMSPNQYVQEVRLQKARHLLENRAKATIAEVGYVVGFSKPDYFSQLFLQRFGKSPSVYLL